MSGRFDLVAHTADHREPLGFYSVPIEYWEWVTEQQSEWCEQFAKLVVSRAAIASLEISAESETPKSTWVADGHAIRLIS